MVSRAAIAVTMGAIALGCSSDGEDRDDDASRNDGGSEDVARDDAMDLEETCSPRTFPPFSVALSPSDSVVVVDVGATPPKPATLDYRGVIDFGWCSKDVTSELRLTLDDPKVGSFAGTTFASALDVDHLGATSIVHASAEGKSGIAIVTVVPLRASEAHRDFLFADDGCHGAMMPSVEIVRVDVPTGAPRDVGFTLSPDAGSPYDATKWIQSVRARGEGTPPGCAKNATRDTNGDGVDDTFVAVAGETVCFEVRPSASPLSVRKVDAITSWAYFDVVDASGAWLDHHGLLFVVSPRDPNCR